MSVPKFSRGEILSADKLNRLAAAVEAVEKLAKSAIIQDVAGGTFSRSAAGTTLSFPVVHPFTEIQEPALKEAPPLTRRRLFGWSVGETPAAEAQGDAPASWTVSVSSGLALVRPIQLEAAASIAGVALAEASAAEFKASVKLPRLAYKFNAETTGSEFAVLTDAQVSKDKSVTTEVDQKLQISVAEYELKKSGSVSAVTALQNGTAETDAQITLPAQTSTSEFATGAVLTLMDAGTLSATPNNGQAWTKQLVEYGAGNKVTLTKSAVTLPAQTVTAKVKTQSVSVGASASVPTGYTLEKTGASTTQEVSVKAAATLPVLDLQTEIVPALLTGGSVEAEETGETRELPVVLGETKLGGAIDAASDAQLSAAVPEIAAGVVSSSADSRLHWVAGAEFTLSPGAQGILIWLVMDYAAGVPAFSWEEEEIPAEDFEAAGTLVPDAPQDFRLDVRAVAVQTGGEDQGEGEAGEGASSASSSSPKSTVFAVGAAARLGRGHAGGTEGTETGSGAAGASFACRVPMAAVWAKDSGGVEVEELSHGVVTFTPRLKITLNGAAGNTETAPEAAAASAGALRLSAAQDLALATAENSLYDLEAEDLKLTTDEG